MPGLVKETLVTNAPADARSGPRGGQSDEGCGTGGYTERCRDR